MSFTQSLIHFSTNTQFSLQPNIALVYKNQVYKYTKIYYVTFCLDMMSYDKINDAGYKFYVRDENTTSKTLSRIKC